jgi:outer membrane protein OmpU
MNKLTKVGLTALASTLIATSANAADWSVSGSASVSYTNVSNTSDTNPFSFGDSVTFSASGDLDNGMAISTKMELDGNVMDDRHLTLSSDSMGSIAITSSMTAGGIGKIGDKVPTAAEEVYDVTDGTDYGLSSQNISSTNQLGWVSSSFNGIQVTAGITPNSDTGADSDNSWAIMYDAGDMVEGLAVGYGQAENGNTAEAETLYVTYSVGGLSVGYQDSTYDVNAASGSDEEGTHIGASFAVNEDLSVSAGRMDVEIGTSASEEENTGFSLSYTMGSMSVTAFANKVDNAGGTAGVSKEAKGMTVAFSF